MLEKKYQTLEHITLCHQSQDSKVSAKSNGTEVKVEASNELISNVAVHYASSYGKRRHIFMTTAIVEAIHHNGSSISIRIKEIETL